MDEFPLDRQIDLGSVNVRTLVPKFHLPAHLAKCHRDYSFNLTRGVGRTDGEAPERGWGYSNDSATATKEMGPGSRRDTLDDLFGDWNWRKICGFGTSVCRLCCWLVSDYVR